MYMYIYVCMYVCMYVYIYMYVYICVYIYVYWTNILNLKRKTYFFSKPHIFSPNLPSLLPTHLREIFFRRHQAVTQQPQRQGKAAASAGPAARFLPGEDRRNIEFMGHGHSTRSLGIQT